MFVELLKSHKKEVEDYCWANGLSVEKVFSASRCYCKDEEILQYCDFAAHTGGEGLSGGGCAIPAPAMLEIYLEDGKLRFVQTEHTYRLMDEPAPMAATA